MEVERLNLGLGILICGRCRPISLIVGRVLVMVGTLVLEILLLATFWLLSSS